MKRRKKKLRVEDIFNEKSIAVFTDASIDRKSNTACSGAVLVYEDFRTEYEDRVLLDSTSNRGEMYAIKLGIEAGLKTGRKNINIFSDSLISVTGLREWIFGWVNKNGKLYNSNKQPVANMELIYEIIQLILDNRHVNINLFHTKGHIDYHDQVQRRKVKELFITHNDGFYIDDRFVSLLKIYNDMVDNNTRANLKVSHNIDEKNKYIYNNLFMELPKNSKKMIKNYKKYTSIYF